MTAIAAIFGQMGGRIDQVLIGDLMLSSPKETRSGYLPLPTGYVPTNKLGDMTPIGWMQKLVLISPTVAFAWAGRPYFARWACGLLRQRFGARIATIALAEEILVELSSECTDEDAFILSVLDRKGSQLWTRHRNASQTFEVTSGYQMLAAGSGDWHLYEGLEHLGKVSGANALGYGMAFVLMMLYRELVSGGSSALAYGGAWEIIYIDRDRFRKLDRPIYSLWTLGLTETDYGVTANLIIAQKYVGDTLYLRSLISRPDGGTTLYHAYANPPDQQSRTKVNHARVKLDSPVHACLIRVDGSPDLKLAIMLAATPAERPFRERKIDPGVGMLVNINTALFGEVAQNHRRP